MNITIVHTSDVHVGKINFMPEKLEIAISEINSLNPDFHDARYMGHTYFEKFFGKRK